MDITFKDRLSKLFPNDTLTTIASKIGMTQAGLFKVFNKNSLPKAETLLKINELTGCDIKWLMTGIGNPYQQLNTPNPADKLLQSDINAPLAFDVIGRPVDIEEFVFIPRYNIEASAGHGSVLHSEESNLVMAFRRYWIKHYLNANPKDLSVIRIKGDSMQGVLNNGDNVLVNHTKNSPQDGLFVLRIDGNLFAKRLQMMPDNKLLIQSANKEYKSFTIDLKAPPNDFEIIGAVEWFGRQLNSF